MTPRLNRDGAKARRCARIFPRSLASFRVRGQAQEELLPLGNEDACYYHSHHMIEPIDEVKTQRFLQI